MVDRWSSFSMRKTLVLKCLVKYGKDFHTMTFSLNDIFSIEKNSADGINLKDCDETYCNILQHDRPQMDWFLFKFRKALEKVLK